MSLCSSASARATEPKTRTLCAPYLACDPEDFRVFLFQQLQVSHGYAPSRSPLRRGFENMIPSSKNSPESLPEQLRGVLGEVGDDEVRAGAADA